MNLVIIPLSDWKSNKDDILETLSNLAHKSLSNPIVISVYDNNINPLKTLDDFYILATVKQLLSPLDKKLSHLRDNSTLIIDSEHAKMEDINKLLLKLKNHFYYNKIWLKQIAIICNNNDIDNLLHFFSDAFYLQPNRKSSEEINRLAKNMFFKANLLRYLGLSKRIKRLYFFGLKLKMAMYRIIQKI